MGLAIAPDAELYLNFRQVPPATLWSEFLLKQIMTYVVRSSGDPAAIATEVQRAIHRVDPEQTVFHVATMQEIVSASVEGRRLAALLLSVLAGLAIVVAAAGLYGVLSYLISQKRRDIAVRMALGARKNDVLWMLVSRALTLYARRRLRVARCNLVRPPVVKYAGRHPALGPQRIGNHHHRSAGNRHFRRLVAGAPRSIYRSASSAARGMSLCKFRQSCFRPPLRLQRPACLV